MTNNESNNNNINNIKYASSAGYISMPTIQE